MFATSDIGVETDLVSFHQYFTRTSARPERRLYPVCEARRQGIATQVTVAPLLPYSPAFAGRLAQALGKRGRVIMDTFVDGDSSGGRRSKRLGMQARLAAARFPGWFECCREHAHALRQQLIAFMGAERVLWSAAGFCDNQIRTANLWKRSGP